jgi:alkaline phosphatase D
MRITRRQILLATPTLLAGCAVGDSAKLEDTDAEPTPTRDPEPAEWSPGGTLDETIFAWGLQSGDPTTTSVILSVRSTETALTVRVVRASGDSWEEHGSFPLTRTDETAQLELDGLVPDTAYRWIVETSTGARTRVGRFRTAPESAFRIVRVGATSCLSGNQPWPNLSWAAAEDLDVFLFLGDAVYAAATTLEEYREDWRAQMIQEGMKAVTARSAAIATWDDHEVANNWSMDALAEGQFEAALAAFRETFPQRIGPGGGLWRSLSWGGIVDFFVLDCRSERADGRYISDAQMSWLKEALVASTARFKIILNSVPITDFEPMFGEIEVDDRWQGYPEERTEILSWIRDEGVAGVLWVAGDLHFGQVSHVDVPGEGGPGAEAWEVLAGPSGSDINPLAALFVDETGQFPEIVSAWNYTRFTLDPGRGTITVAFIGDDAAVITETTLAV